MICGLCPEPSRVVVQFQVQFCLDFPCLLPEIVVVPVYKSWVVFSWVVFVCGGLLSVVDPVTLKNPCLTCVCHHCVTPGPRLQDKTYFSEQENTLNLVPRT